MSTQVKLKRSSVAAKVPLVGDLDLGELAINTYDGKIFIKKNDGADSIVTFEETTKALVDGLGIAASTAVTLQTARTINGTSFNGSANITTANWGTARTLTLGDTGKSVNGSANVTWTVSELGAADKDLVLTAGDGLSGGGNLTANRSFAVDSTVVRTTGTQTIGGTKTFSNDVILSSDLHMDAAGQTIYFGSTVGSVGYIRQSSGGQLQLGSDNLIEFIESDANTVTISMSTNSGDIIANGVMTAATFNATTTSGGGFQGIDADSATVPSFTWTSDQNTGMWHSASDAIGFTTGGTNRVTINSSGLTVNSGALIGSLTGNASTATTLQTARTISLGGDLSGSASFNGGSNITITATVANDSHTHAFDNLTGLTAATSQFSTSGSYIEAGRGGGGVALTLNDGYGNSNVTFNHNAGTPDQTGNSARIEVNTDATTAATMNFGVKSNTINGVATGLTTVLSLTETQIYAQSGAVFVGPLTGNATTATALQTARTISLGGVLSGSVSFDGSGNVTLTAAHTSDPVLTLSGDATGSATFTNLGNATLSVAVVDDSHGHSFNNLLNKTSGTGNYTTTGVMTAATFNATTTSGGGFQGIDGDLATTPSFTWTSDTNTGIWKPASDQIGFTTGGTNRITISSAGLTVNSGALIGALTGNASTATTLQTARTIALSGAATGTATSFNGSSNITIPVTALNASNLNAGTVPDARLAGTYTGVSITGNAATATKWATSRTISLGGVLSGSVALDGSGNVTLTAAHTSDPVITLTGAVTGSGTMTNLGSVSIATTATADPTLTLSGDATGSATFTNLGNATLTVAVVDDSHGHSFDNLLNKTSGTGNYTTTGVMTAATFNATTTSGGGFQGIDGDTASSPSFTWTSDTNTGIFKQASDSVGITTGGGERVRINSTGLNIIAGIINHTGNGSKDKIRVWSSGSYAIGMLNGITYGSITDDYAMTFQMSNQSTRGFWWGSDVHTSAQGAMSLSTDGKLNVATALRLGYGESDTTIAGTNGALDVNGTVTAATFNATSTSNGGFQGIDADTAASPSFTWTSDQNTGIWHSAADEIGFSTGGTARVKITNAGIYPATDNTMEVGNSALTFSRVWATNMSVDSTLDVRGAIDLADNDILRLGSSDDWEFFHNGTHNYMDLNVGDLIIRDNTTTRFTFSRTTGNLTVTGDINSTSDERLKTDIVVIPQALNKLKAIRGVNFTLLENGNRSTGVIAQDVEKVLPEAVNERDDGYKTVAYGNMVGLLVEAIKEQDETINTMQSQINELTHLVQLLLAKDK